MTREQILAEIDELEREIHRLNDEIEDGYRELPNARKADRQSRKMMEMNLPNRVFLDAETKLNRRIIENRNRCDELRGARNELRAQLRGLSDRRSRDDVASDGPRHQGTIKSFDPHPQKNFGFIRVDGQPDVFVRGSAVSDRGQLEVGDQVTFKRVNGPKGFKAVDVRFVADGAGNTVDRSEPQRDAARPLQTIADPVAAELEAALALRRSGADPKALRRALRRIEELLDE